MFGKSGVLLGAVLADDTVVFKTRNMGNWIFSSPGANYVGLPTDEVLDVKALDGDGNEVETTIPDYVVLTFPDPIADIPIPTGEPANYGVTAVVQNLRTRLCDGWNVEARYFTWPMPGIMSFQLGVRKDGKVTSELIAEGYTIDALLLMEFSDKVYAFRAPVAPMYEEEGVKSDFVTPYMLFPGGGDGILAIAMVVIHNVEGAEPFFAAKGVDMQLYYRRAAGGSPFRVSIVETSEWRFIPGRDVTADVTWVAGTQMEVEKLLYGEANRQLLPIAPSYADFDEERSFLI
jgi:hypothetical protein